ncbi:hypothetical protein B1992_04645 [Pseudoxanthomonas broegbernensis]|uniref:Uncharacterized protein n=1 Tax=Pseudoxanthomonas broegbernensis TaxID=83619 RepID=A0A7V8GNX0_9GAMM|nr:hypothetical protein [Pseudoxanthomonas broegbernensis]KAF1687274.1 hypothetical protein B1992_04645 [Pseudoxanthomonas broegbernensis]MBB6065733.1 putative lipoprotein with Yx(FWY)xxD motif [Pseudoxanthomonas broegbernensis]
MSMPHPSMRIAASIFRAVPRRPSGIGLVQVMLILLLVATTLAAGAVLLQSRRAPAQAITQEQSLRWADEAVTAFAAANARLPCPSRTVHGVEDCSPGNAKGWLPLRTLLGASGTAPQIGPTAYMVYRGDEAAHHDLTNPGNAYQPPGLDGNVREIVVSTDAEGEPTATRPFVAINGLDLCRSLQLADDGTQATLARVQTQEGTALNVAYGIAAAGPTAGDTARLDGSNSATGSITLDAPWREWDSGYDDRVRIRTFDGVGQMLGCRMQRDGTAATATAAAPAAPFALMAATSVDASTYDVSLAAMDILAAAVTVHDSLGELQENNVGNTEASVLDAGFAQAAAIASVLLSAGQITDGVSTMVTAATSLVRAVATCIASLGATCWEVPLKATALGLSIGSVVTNAVALGLNVGALVPTAMALAKTIDARDRAKKAAAKKPKDLKSAIDELACSLYGGDPPDLGYNPCSPDSKVKIGEDGEPVLKRDAQGFPIPVRDEDGRQLFDTNGKPLYEYVYVVDDNPPGLDDKRDQAKAQWEALKEHSDVLLVNRIAPWSGEYADAAQSTRIAGRINEGASWELHGKRYQTIKVTCVPGQDGKGEYIPDGSNCKYVGSKTETVEGNTVTTLLGTHDRKEETVFNWDLAVRDAIAKRKLAERWAENNRRVGEIDREVEELQKNWNQWFVGTSQVESIYAGMVRERNKFCALPQGDRINFEKCESAKEGVTYINTCRKGTGKLDQNGNRITEVDTDPLANCRLRMQERLDNTRAEKQSAANARSAAATAYNSALAPWMAYPDGWFYHAIEVIKDSDGNPIRYDWLDSRNDDRNRETYYVDCVINEVASSCAQTRRLPYYAPEPYYNGWGYDNEPQIYPAPRLLVTSNLEIYGKNTCNFFNNTWWWGGWGDARFHGIYCQRYPYNRAYEDWDRAKDATLEAEKTYEGLREQFDKLKAEYDDLRNQGEVGPNGAITSPIGFGAEPALERADSRGSVGARPVQAVTP